MLVLASGSPRRRQILNAAGFSFVLRPAQVDESPVNGETPQEHVRRLAKLKAESVAVTPNEIVLAADTIVVVDGEILGKPKNTVDARNMLRRLSGRDHLVITGICLREADCCVLDAETTRVWFIPLTELEIDEYVATGEPMDKAGAYAAQGVGSRFIERIEGCYFNVVGLPVALVYKYLRQRGVADLLSGSKDMPVVQ
jgi:septum formation protein